MSRKSSFAKVGLALLCLAVLGALVLHRRGGDHISPDEAKDHIGQTLTVRGEVFEVHSSKSGTVFMNMGAPFPDQPFTVVCFKGAVPVELLRKFEGRKISVTGEIKDYKGQPEIILDALDQIK